MLHDPTIAPGQQEQKEESSAADDVEQRREVHDLNAVSWLAVSRKESDPQLRDFLIERAKTLDPLVAKGVIEVTVPPSAIPARVLADGDWPPVPVDVGMDANWKAACDQLCMQTTVLAVQSGNSNHSICEVFQQRLASCAPSLAGDSWNVGEQT